MRLQRHFQWHRLRLLGNRKVVSRVLFCVGVGCALAWVLYTWWFEPLRQGWLQRRQLLLMQSTVSEQRQQQQQAQLRLQRFKALPLAVRLKLARVKVKPLERQWGLLARQVHGCHLNLQGWDQQSVDNTGGSKTEDVLRLKGRYKGIHCFMQRIGESPPFYWPRQVDIMESNAGDLELTLRLSL